MSSLVQLRRHVTQLRSCAACPDMIGPVVTGQPVLSPVMLIGQAPGVKEGPAGKPFAWTAGKTMFGWFASLGMSEDEFRSRVYMAAVCRCFPGKATGGGDRVPSPEEIERCHRHLATEVRILRPKLVIPVGKLAIAQLIGPEAAKQLQLKDIVGTKRTATLAGIDVDMIALPHPSGASTWHRVEPGKTLLAKALGMIGRHEAWRSIVDAAPHGDALTGPASATP
ncbi:MAG: uracil-DNA glycosylase family protein [Kofleriaceae bacterium]